MKVKCNNEKSSDNLMYIFERLCSLTNISIFKICRDGKINNYSENKCENPLQYDKQLQEILINKSKEQDIPVIYQDVYKVFWGCIKKENEFYFIGPMSIETLSYVDIHKYCCNYNIAINRDISIPKYSLTKLLLIIEIVANYILRKEYSKEELIYVNKLTDNISNEIDKKQILFDIDNDDEEDRYHHTYKEEIKLLDCVREGRAKEALDYNRKMDLNIGILSQNDINHWRNLGIVAITLYTRAAIEGGVSPTVAYQLSDFYIQNIDKCKDIIKLIEYRDKAIIDFIQRVLKEKKTKDISYYVRWCKDYISKNYRRKIYLDDMAGQMNISSSYLSKLFYKETGTNIQEYINEFRIGKATNLLIYSNDSISSISESVNFHSQSYFGKIFKKYKGITPKEYRAKYKTLEV